jgi:iron complex transport system substrate-binding protein
VVGLMTAAKMQNIAVSSQKYVTVFATAGTSIAVTAGDKTDLRQNPFQAKRCGTINIAVLVDGNLTDSCMVDAVKTVTEAKTVALRELDIRSRLSGDVATGTVTDSVVVACTKKGNMTKYAGTFTMLGELISKSVREAVKTAIYKQEKLAPNRPLIKRLEERGITIESIMSLLCQSNGIRENPKKQHQLKKQIEIAFSDEKIASLVITSLRFDDDSKIGLIPESQVDNSVDKTAFEEIVQTVVNNYLSDDATISDIGGFNKDKISNENGLGPLTKRVFLAILNKACSNILD